MNSRLIWALAAISLAGPALAQGGPGPGRGPGPGMGPGMGMRAWDPKTITTVAGEVTAVHDLQGRRGNTGIHVDLKAGEVTYDVHLGPAAFLSDQKLELKAGDRIEITGSKVELAGRPALIAQTIRRGDATVKLRDDQGVPVWPRLRGR